MRLVRAGGPPLLPVDDPFIAAELGPRYRTGDVRSAARFAEQLAPDILTGQYAQQEILLLPVGAMLKDRRSSKGAGPHLRDAIPPAHSPDSNSLPARHGRRRGRRLH